MSAFRDLQDEAAGADAPVSFVASFQGQRAPGSVVGRDGVTGVDVEQVIGTDHGALRIRPLVEPGWGRSAVAWGPYPSRSGLAAGFVVLNGHNASENIDPWPSFGRYLVQWARGTQVDPVLARLWAYHRYGGRDGLRRRLAARRANRRAIASGTTQAENLAVGLLGSPAPLDAGAGGPAFVVRSTGPTNAVLTAGRHRTPILEQLQNVPLHLVIVLREQGALFLVGSLPGVPGTAAAPEVRPVLVDTTPVPAALWAGVHQAVLGQVGWGVDTRVDDVRLASPATLGTWYTTAHVAARAPFENGAVVPATAERGGAWTTVTLDHARRLEVAHPGEPTGLVHALVRIDGAEQRVGVALRVDAGRRTGWTVTASATGVAAERHRDGEARQRHGTSRGLPLAETVGLQVLDDGTTLTVVIDGEVVLGPFAADGQDDGDGVGVGVRWFDEHDRGSLTEFEAHPRAVRLPAGLCPPAPPVPCGRTPVYDDGFDGIADSLHGRPIGATRWEHTVGNTPFALDGNGVVVRPVPRSRGRLTDKLANLVRTEDHRNLFTVPWPDPTLADLTVTLVAPGSGRGQGQRGRGGLVFRQDHDHQLIVNTWIDDEYDGTSVSSFLRIGGFEDVYDAVWTNVGRRITWGRPYDLRVAFDGTRYVVYVDDEPVLYRRITDIVPGAGPLRIERVGIVSNWEFGDDTGSRFLGFRATRAGSAAPATGIVEQARAHHGRPPAGSGATTQEGRP